MKTKEKFKRAYNIWHCMLKRCNYKRHHAYKHYGGRGIKVCKRWMKFENFLADMGDVPIGLTLERIDNNADYSPSNCKWATMKEQGSNRRNNLLLTYNGVTFTESEWARRLGIKRSTLEMRLRRGWPIEKALTKKIASYSKDGA